MATSPAKNRKTHLATLILNLRDFEMALESLERQQAHYPQHGYGETKSYLRTQVRNAQSAIVHAATASALNFVEPI